MIGDTRKNAAANCARPHRQPAPRHGCTTVRTADDGVFLWPESYTRATRV